MVFANELENELEHMKYWLKKWNESKNIKNLGIIVGIEVRYVVILFMYSHCNLEHVIGGAFWYDRGLVCQLENWN